MSAFTLSLSPAWGDTTFGPFQGTTVQLGSDPESCQIQLGTAHGVSPIHAVIWRGADGSFGLQPGTMGAAIYLFTSGSPMARPVMGPVQAHAGDAFALVSPQGPRFIIAHAAPMAANTPAHRPPAPSILPSAAGMEHEVRRQITSRLGAGPLAGANQLLHKVKSGQLMQPRYILGGLAALLTGIMALFSWYF